MITPLLLQADARRIPLPTGLVHCVVTSPPYWGLRDYGNPEQIGLETVPDCLGWATGAPCGQCYVCRMVAVMREVRRVLRADGTLWLNLGDSYANDTKWGGRTGGKHVAALHGQPIGRRKRKTGLKPKDMVGIPWRIAFALQADGWYLRSDVIWSKPNAMPESVADRPTKAHEYVFLLAKSKQYFYDAVAVQEPLASSSLQRVAQAGLDEQQGGFETEAYQANHPGRKQRDRRPADIVRATRDLTGRNRRTVWSIAPTGYDGAHFAVMPVELAETCVKAGTSEMGVCPACGAPWQRIVERTGHSSRREPAHQPGNTPTKTDSTGWQPATRPTDNWLPTCACNSGDPIPATVLDPFVGSGTTLLAARALGRAGIGLDLSANYLAQARGRLDLDRLAAWEGNSGAQTERRQTQTNTDGDTEALPLFALEPVDIPDQQD